MVFFSSRYEFLSFAECLASSCWVLCLCSSPSRVGALRTRVGLCIIINLILIPMIVIVIVIVLSRSNRMIFVVPWATHCMSIVYGEWMTELYSTVPYVAELWFHGYWSVAMAISTIKRACCNPSRFQDSLS
ncbi:hypothetical protein BP00DRAFT_35796 [Aspergillus indologenus CBS 114.80]|uniref:Uncharacterized protein n=1 Tax=Aspergillus indologenus CBS 114.80 TaxID=1450541 RepID=A0A2V5HRD8_9EURO|nr:hypothetical protein BP00DRAFT_35796 [Aspergillus indologenus CBS 114.80]